MIDPIFLTDQSAYQISEDILKQNCKYILFTSMYNNFASILYVSSVLKKKNKDLVIILGGPHVTMCAKETLELFDGIDYIVCGEGEITTTE